MAERNPLSPSSDRLIWPVSLFRWRYVKRGSPWVMVLFLLGIFIDYGGGFGIKLALTLVALGWVVTRKATLPIWAKCRWDLMFLLGIPVTLGALHVLMNPSVDYLTGLEDLYSTVSSPLFLLLLPLVYLAGAGQVRRMLIIGFVLVALAMIGVASLHVVGVIDVYSYAGWARTYRVGFAGLDPRQPDLPNNLRPIVAPGIGYALVFGFGLALATSWVWAGLMAVALMILKARGMLLGAMLAAGLWLVLNGRYQRFKFGLRELAWGGAALILILTLFFKMDFGELLAVSVDEMVSRFEQTARIEDFNTQVRVAHFKGYFDSLAKTPFGALVGFGPSARLYNPVLGHSVQLTEMPALNMAMWYGVPYMILYVIWLYGSVFRLWSLRRKPGYTGQDTALVVGATAFWLAGNTNPVMITPIGMIALILIRVRILELTGYRPILGSANG